MILRYPLARRLAVSGTAAFTALAAAGLVLIFLAVQPAQLVSLGTVVAVVFAGACLAWYLRVKAFARHPFRAVSARHVIAFRPRESRGDGVMLASATVASETEFEAIEGGLKFVRLQKFVVEPTALDPQDLLQDWGYSARISGADLAATPYVSPSRSLQLDVPLETPPRPGARFTISENLSFDVFLDAPARLVFQPSYPSGRQTIFIAFDGPKAVDARFRVERGLGRADSGPLASGDAGIAFVWERAVPGEQLVIEWEWDPDTLPEPRDETEYLMAEARRRQAETQERLAAQYLEEQESGAGQGDGAVRIREILNSGRAAGLPGDAGFSDDVADTTPAEEHPIIKAARAREKLYKNEDEG